MHVSNSNSCIEVSVVIGVYNAEHVIADTLQSVLSQTGPLFELIVVDDGSTDNSASVIKAVLAGQPRTVFLQSETNQGLTRSLILGCDRATGKYIARIDAGDRYLRGRLAAQVEVFKRDASIGLVSCGTRFLSEKGEELYIVVQQPQDLEKGLKHLDLKSIQGPSHHGSTMFRRDVYEQVGGYRLSLQVAQDLDLWMRMIESTKVLAISDVLYESTISIDSISVRKIDQQMKTAKFILECARCRRNGLPEPAFDPALIGSSLGRRESGKEYAARYHYFVGSCLEKENRKKAQGYFLKAWKDSPFRFKYAARYLRSLVI